MKKTVEQEITLCDICGYEADGDYYLTEYATTDVTHENAIVGEYSCPLDLCKRHMRDFEGFVYSYSGNPLRDLLNERYDGAEKESKVLEKFKDWLEENPGD